MSKKILLIGGAGYVGTMLAEDLSREHDVGVYDLFIYGDNFVSTNIKKFRGDIRNIDLLKKVVKSFDTVIHLACISNDPSFDLNPELGKSINYDCFEQQVKICKDNGIKKFIYASSSSVYGVKKNIDVDENASLEPLTDYSIFKAKCEEVLLKHHNKDFICTVLRPATVCGFSLRQRLDLVVNILTNHAYNEKKITIFGGKQLRPNINIKDMIDAYKIILNSENSLVAKEIFNVGFENYSVEKLSNIVESNFKEKIKINKIKSNDDRSYHISSKKISKILNFTTKYNIDEAVKGLINAFKNNKLKDPLNNEMYFNIKRMNSINLK